MASLVIGIDVGTQGVRILAVDRSGKVCASASEALPPARTDLPAGWAEQQPDDWWRATITCLRRVLAALAEQGIPGEEIAALAVDSTSGTVLPVDRAGRALSGALMYNDSRSAPYVDEVRAAASALEDKLGYAIRSSFALPKIVWMMRERPDIHRQTALYIHAADYIVGKLTGEYGVTDHSNALKTGFDLVDYGWPDFIERDLGVALEKLPRVVAPGDPIAAVSSEAARLTGLAAGTVVVGGMTDGSAAQVASGASEVGAWNSILGTTLVIKGITANLIKDPAGRFYCHLHPNRSWMPGGASNTGCKWIVQDYPGADPAALDRAAEPCLPTNLIRYPLARSGERFPFVAPDAAGFVIGEPDGGDELYAAGLEGLAYLERLAYETLIELGAEVGDTLYVTGGGARSPIWLRVRASVLSRRLLRPAVSETAMGAALLAASQTLFDSLAGAARHMVTVDHEVEPHQPWIAPYEEGYGRFVETCRARGYIK